MRRRSFTLVSILSVFAISSLLVIAFMTRAANVSVCASGCDFATITDAASSGLNPTDVITVGLDYASTTETFPVSIPQGVTLDCQNSGAIIGSDDYTALAVIVPEDDVTIQNCQFSNTRITAVGKNSISVLNNEFTGDSLFDPNGGTNMTAVGNDGLIQIAYYNIQTGIIDNNTILSHAGYGYDGLRIQSATSITVTNNVINDQTTTTNNNFNIISIINGSADIDFSDNTIQMSQMQSYTSGMSMIQVSSVGVRVERNRLYLNGLGQGNAFNLNGNFEPVGVELHHNTILMGPECNQCTGMLMTSWTVNRVDVTSTYNLIAGTSSSTGNTLGHQYFDVGPSSNNSVFSEYNGYSGLKTVGSDATFPAGPNSIIRTHNELKTDDVSSGNDFEPVPWSAFLDVNGIQDMGAVSLSRGSNFTVNPAGTIDYTSVHATNTHAIPFSLRDSDTMNLADGTFTPFTLGANTYLTGNVTVQGNGVGTIVDVPSSATGSAITLDGVTDSRVQNLVASHASTSIATTYLISRSQYTDGVTTYDEGAGLGAPNAVFYVADIIAPGSCTTGVFFSDDSDANVLVGPATSPMSLALVNIFGSHVTLLVPNSETATGAELDNCAPGSVTVDHFIPSIFTVSGGVYTYNAAAASGAGVSIKPGDTDPAYLNRVLTGTVGGGFAFLDADNNTISNVTSTDNSNAVYFGGTSAGNTIRNSTFSGSLENDVFSQSSGNNTLVNVYFARTSSTITDVGEVLVRFGVRAYIENPMGFATDGAVVTWTSANNATSTSMTTGGTGFTPTYTYGLPAYTLTSASIAATSGGFNPYTVSVVASGANASPVSMTVTSVNQLVSIALVNGPSVGTGGGGGGLGAPENQAILPIGVTNTLPIPTASSTTQTPTTSPDRLIKIIDDRNPATTDDSIVYALGSDGKRHIFRNLPTYLSWYCDFSRVETIPRETLEAIPLGGNITVRPGLHSVKFIGSPIVYVIQPGGVLRAILSEHDAAKLLGADWVKRVIDIPDLFFGDYRLGRAIQESELIHSIDLNISPVNPSENGAGEDQGELTRNTDPICRGTLPVAPAKTSWPFKQMTSTFSFTTLLGPDSSDRASIRALQEVLIKFGQGIYPEAVVSGVYSEATLAAVRRFQVVNGLKSTGATGPQTREALNKILDTYR